MNCLWVTSFWMATQNYQTYRELLGEARLIAAGLSNLGLKQGDKVIIATLYNRETIELLWGCFFLGAVPTILQPP